MNLLSHDARQGAYRAVSKLGLGLFLGGLFTLLSEKFLPDSATRDFLTTSVSAEVGPLSLDVVAVAFSLGPLVLHVNVLSLVGVALVALVARSFF
jgi:hypothetical protein